MELNKLYDIADRENISVIDFKMKNKAIIAKVDKKYCVGLNYSNINNSCEEKELLAEELGHYYCNAFYNTHTDETVIRKKEYRARKWAFTSLVPASKVLFLQDEGYKYCYEIADALEVSEELVKQAYDYYIENNYI